MKNKSGINPVGNKILIKPDSLEETTEGGIVIPGQVKDRHDLSACYGYVIAVGPDCFTHTVTDIDRYIDGRWRPFEQRTVRYSKSWCKPGDRIAFAPYSSAIQTGADGEEYWIINDEDVTALVAEDVTQTTIEARKPYSAA
jgi:co-chaperonin GroES (HSP10)